MDSAPTKVMLNQIVNIIKEHYSHIPIDSIPTKVKDQVIPLLISIFFKEAPEKMIELQRSLEQDGVCTSDQVDMIKSLLPSDFDLERIGKVLAMYLTVEGISRRVKRQTFTIFQQRNKNIRKAVTFVLAKSKKTKIASAIQRFILNSRLVKLQFEGVKVIDNLFSRQLKSNRRLFLKILKDAIRFGPNREKIRDFMINVNALFLRRQRVAYQRINTYFSSSNRWKARVIKNAALKSEISVQNSLWRLQNFTEKTNKLNTFCDKLNKFALRQFLAELKHHKTVLQEVKQSKNVKTRRIGEDKENILLKVTSNLLSKKIFEQKMGSFIGIERYASEKTDF